MDALDDFRDSVSQPVTLSCAFRCRKHNTSIDSNSDTSQHPLGTAADIQLLEGGWTVELMEQAAEEIEAFASGGIGLYDWGIHVDVRQDYDGLARWDDRNGSA